MSAAEDDPDFIARLAEAHHALGKIPGRITRLKREAYAGIRDLGESLLQVQESKAGEFADWFSFHEPALGFSLRTAERYKAEARRVRALGFEAAFALVGHSETPASETPKLCAFRVPADSEAIANLPIDRARKLLELLPRIIPLLEARVAAEPLDDQPTAPPTVAA